MNTGRARRGSIRLLAGVALSILAEQATALAQASDADLRQALRSLSQQEDIGRTLAILDRAVQAEPRLGVAHLLTGDLFALMGGVQPPAALAVSPAAADQTARETRLRPPSDMSELRSDLKARAAHLLRARDTLPRSALQRIAFNLERNAL